MNIAHIFLLLMFILLGVLVWQWFSIGKKNKLYGQNNIYGLGWNRGRITLTGLLWIILLLIGLNLFGGYIFCNKAQHNYKRDNFVCKEKHQLCQTIKGDGVQTYNFELGGWGTCSPFVNCDEGEYYSLDLNQCIKRDSDGFINDEYLRDGNQDVDLIDPITFRDTHRCTERGYVTHVVDGDTIDVDGQRVRLLGINTPEIGSPGYQDAKEYLSDLVLYKQVCLVRDTISENKDKYNRLLRYVYLDDTLINTEMIYGGYTDAYTKYNFGLLPYFINYVSDPKNKKGSISQEIMNIQGECEYGYHLVEDQCIPISSGTILVRDDNFLKQKGEYTFKVDNTEGEYNIVIKIAPLSSVDHAVYSFYVTEGETKESEVLPYGKYIVYRMLLNDNYEQLISNKLQSTRDLTEETGSNQGVVATKGEGDIIMEKIDNTYFLGL